MDVMVYLARPLRSPQLTRREQLVVVDDPAELLRRLESGDWLLPGEVVALTGASRTTIYRRMRDGTIGTRMRPGTKWRVCNPEDVRRLLEESMTEHRGE